MMWNELIGKVDEMFGAGLLTLVAVYAMHMGINSGIVEMSITGVIALLVTRAVKSGGD